MTREEFERIRPLSKEEYEKWVKEEFEKIRQVPKEEYEKWKMEQIKLEMQSPLYFGDKVPEEIKDSDEFLNTLKEKLKDYGNRIIGYSQECVGTFTVKDGKVTDIHLTGIVLIPRFKDGAKK